MHFRSHLCISEAAWSLKLDAHRFCVPSMNVWLKFRIPWIFALKQVYTEQLMLSTWLRSAILYVSHVNVSSSLSWSVFHFSTILAVTALFFTALLAASTLLARLFFPDIATDSARTFSLTNSHMVGHVTLLSGYCPMTDRYHKPCKVTWVQEKVHPHTSMWFAAGVSQLTKTHPSFQEQGKVCTVASQVRQEVPIANYRSICCMAGSDWSVWYDARKRRSMFLLLLASRWIVQ